MRWVPFQNCALSSSLELPLLSLAKQTNGYDLRLVCETADVVVINSVICRCCVVCQCLLSTVHSAPVQGGASDNNSARDSKNKSLKCRFTAQITWRTRLASVSLHGSTSRGMHVVIV